MLILKGCPKCHGDLQVRADTYGAYCECLQCGFLQNVDPQRLRAVQETLAARRRAKQAAA
jgi:hypothetical protein